MKRLLTPFSWASVSLHGNCGWKVAVPAPVMVCAWNPSTYKLEQEDGEVWGQPGLYIETLSLKQLIKPGMVVHASSTWAVKKT